MFVLFCGQEAGVQVELQMSQNVRIVKPCCHLKDLSEEAQACDVFRRGRRGIMQTVHRLPR